MKTYEAEVHREGEWYMIYIPEIGQLTQSPKPEQNELMARECVAVTLDLPLDEVRVALEVVDR